MLLQYKNKRIEAIIIALNIVAATAAMVTFVLLHGFYKPLLPVKFLYLAQIGLVAYFIIEKIIRYFNIINKGDFWRMNWHEVVLILLIIFILTGVANRWFGNSVLLFSAIGGYLIWQMVNKFCRTSVRLAAWGKS